MPATHMHKQFIKRYGDHNRPTLTEIEEASKVLGLELVSVEKIRVEDTDEGGYFTEWVVTLDNSRYPQLETVMELDNAWMEH